MPLSIMKTRNRETLVLAAAAALSLAVYLAASAATTGTGFPLDDAWIHQTYARNFARGLGWSFYPGQPSAGLTAPLWALLLAAGHTFKIGPFILTFTLGWLCLWALSQIAVKLTHTLVPEQPRWGLAAGLLVCIEWHLVWATASGMETLLFSLVVTLTLAWLVWANNMEDHTWLVLGVLAGGSAWLRPEGITLLAPLLLVWLCKKRRWQAVGALLLGFAAAFLPYLAFNCWLAGAWWPNTFYAKQAEYAILRDQPLIARLLSVVSLPLVGAGALLLPGFFFQAWKAVREKRWPVIAAYLWVVGYTCLYAIRLPVTYQHGRYIIPAMPLFFLLGLAGTAALVKPQSGVLWLRILSRAGLASLVLVSALFWGLGARAYARDVAVINTEMVATAHWIKEHSQATDLIAAHDIGALGYFAERPLLDLAGLVSPDVIPIIRDERALAVYLDEQAPLYLMTFPGWYPQLTAGKEAAFSTKGVYSPRLGGENMAAYLWVSP